jgi:hypothetical protein
VRVEIQPEVGNLVAGIGIPGVKRNGGDLGPIGQHHDGSVQVQIKSLMIVVWGSALWRFIAHVPVDLALRTHDYGSDVSHALILASADALGPARAIEVAPDARDKRPTSEAKSRPDDSRSILLPCSEHERRIMHWFNCAERETTPIDTSPSRSIWSTSRQWRRFPNTTFTVCSLPPMVEHPPPTSPGEELNAHRIYSDPQTSRSLRSASQLGSAVSARSAADSRKLSANRRVHFNNGTQAKRPGYRVATCS